MTPRPTQNNLSYGDHSPQLQSESLIQAELNLPLIYEEADVVSAQRLRFRHSTRLRVMAWIGIAAVALFTAQWITPGRSNASGHSMWVSPLLMGAIFILVPLAIYLIAPPIDSRVNPNWRQQATLHVDDHGLRITLAGVPGALDLDWARVQRVLENDRVIMLFFGSDQEFLVVPKHIFASPEQLQSVRSRITLRGVSNTKG